jgi:DNA-binding beta-propeller fold protein YncE
MGIRAARHARGWRAASALGLATALALVESLGCATAATRPGAWERVAPGFVWPPPPETARIGYLGRIRSGADLGRTEGWLTRLGNAVFGKEPKSLVKPISVARNPAGLLVVADPGIPMVHFFDLARREYRWLDDELAWLLASPVGVAVDDRGNAYVTDSVRRKVFVFDHQRRLAGEFGGDVLQRPTGIALDLSQERIYVVDTLACQVLTFDRDGRILDRFGSCGTGPGRFHGPTYVAVTPDGSLAVSDSLNFRVQTFRPDGTPLGSFGGVGDSAGDFARPKGVASDAQGRLYVVDGAFDNVQIFDGEDSRLLMAFGGSGDGAGEFNLPVGVFLDSTNTIWVADSFNQCLQVFRLLKE